MESFWENHLNFSDNSMLCRVKSFVKKLLHSSFFDIITHAKKEINYHTLLIVLCYILLAIFYRIFLCYYSKSETLEQELISAMTNTIAFFRFARASIWQRSRGQRYNVDSQAKTMQSRGPIDEITGRRSSLAYMPMVVVVVVVQCCTLHAAFQWWMVVNSHGWARASSARGKEKRHKKKEKRREKKERAKRDRRLTS